MKIGEDEVEKASAGEDVMDGMATGNMNGFGPS